MAKSRRLPDVDPEASLFVHAAVAIGTRLDELISFEDSLDDSSQILRHHEMRIAAKRLRYTLELFQSAYREFSTFGPQIDDAIKTVKLIQEFLGDIHDADVLAPRLAEEMVEQLVQALPTGKRAEPRVGVGLVDFDAVQGILTICIEARNTRNSQFAALREEWNRITEAGQIDGLRKALRGAITEETVARVLHESATEVTSSAVAPAVVKAVEEIPIQNLVVEPVDENKRKPRSRRSTAPSSKLSNSTE